MQRSTLALTVAVIAIIAVMGTLLLLQSLMLVVAV
jgi:hypothetical protein